MVMDLGRNWMQQNGLKKSVGTNGTFLTWSSHHPQHKLSTIKTIPNQSIPIHYITMKNLYNSVSNNESSIQESITKIID